MSTSSQEAAMPPNFSHISFSYDESLVVEMFILPSEVETNSFLVVCDVAQSPTTDQEKNKDEEDNPGFWKSSQTDLGFSGFWGS